jgi:hypothetical protein
MAQQSVVTTPVNSGFGDTLPAAFNKVNANFSQLYGGANSLTVSGYRTDPVTGFIEQWGRIIVTTGTPLAVTFNTNGINFPTACWQVMLSLSSPSGSGNTCYLTTDPTTTGFTANVAGSAGTSGVFWRAIGN